jgi:hypothetical protein
MTGVIDMTISNITKRLGVAAATLASVLLLAQPVPAQAARGGGGGFHGGGFHGGGFHGGGFHGGGFHGFRGGFEGFHGGGHFAGRNDWGGWGWGGALGLAGAFGYGWDDYPDYGGYAGATAYAPSGYWYYCQNPAGYYPYVTQCTVGWQAVPAS